MAIKLKSIDDDEKKPFVLAKRRFIPIGDGVVIQVEPFDQKSTPILMPDISTGRVQQQQVTGDAVTAIVISIGMQVMYLKIGMRVVVGTSPIGFFYFEDKIEVGITTEGRFFGYACNEDPKLRIQRAREIIGEEYDIVEEETAKRQQLLWDKFAGRV